MHNFKEGDWVRILDPLPGEPEVCQLTHSDFYGVGRKSSKYFEDIELWKPKNGEWCWFWDNTNDIPLLSPLCSILEYEIFGSLLSLSETEDDGERITHHEKYIWKNCQPFIGKVPEF